MSQFQTEVIKEYEEHGYTVLRLIRLNKSGYSEKMKSYNVNVCKFIRDAIKEKINREYSELIPKEPKEYNPFGYD